MDLNRRKGENSKYDEKSEDKVNFKTSEHFTIYLFKEPKNLQNSLNNSLIEETFTPTIPDLIMGKRINFTPQ